MSDASSPYTIRLYEPDDKAEFLDLFETVFGGASEEWFRWKYLQNPYVSHVPMYVAEADGELVGARPYMTFRLRVGSATPLGLQTGDTMVHPDHQRKGLFTRMTRQSFEYYGDLEDQVLTFSVPNALSRPGYVKLGCHVVGSLPAQYRLVNPAAMTDGPLSVLATAASPITKRLLAAWDVRAKTPAEVTVSQYDEIPIERFADLYERAIPEGIHALRDERFYGWRFDRPDWSYTAYTASESGETTAGAIVGIGDRNGAETVALTETVPLAGGENRNRGIRSILDRVVSRHDDVDTIVARRGAIPQPILREYGFLPDDRLPLSAVSTPTKLITRIFDGTDDPPWTLEGRDLRILENWSLSLAEQNSF